MRPESQSYFSVPNKAASKCHLWTSSIDITQDLTEMQILIPPQTYWIRYSNSGALQSGFGAFDTWLNLRTTGL